MYHFHYKPTETFNKALAFSLITMADKIILIYNHLSKFFGPLHWWPMDHTYHAKNGSDPRFEVIIGAILTQNTAWSNVEKALLNVKNENKLDLLTINHMDYETLKSLIKPSGFFNQKADRLKIICSYLLENYNGNLDTLFSQPIADIRNELLTIKGIGPETADSILLYAGNKPIFVVDAYTKRLCKRIPLSVDSASYDMIQMYFQQSLEKTYPKSKLSKIYNEYHAIIVELGKQFCGKQKPKCMICPLKNICSYQ